MKKILLFALPVLAICFASCEKNNNETDTVLSGDDVISFVDPNFLQALLIKKEVRVGPKKYIEQNVDANGDGQITVNEAQTVTALELYDADNEYTFGIKEMPEIKYFTSLQYLICSENQLTSLDVTKNIALKKLDCQSNQISELNIDNNPDLEYLYCQRNQINTLKTTKNSKLIGLSCGKNKISTIDLSNNISLTYSNFDDNQIKVADISNNNELRTFSIQRNPIETLIISTAQEEDKYGILRTIRYQYPNINVSVKQ